MWQTYFRDQDLLDEIQKDVRRTRTELNFFKIPTDPEQIEKYSKEEIAKFLGV